MRSLLPILALALSLDAHAASRAPGRWTYGGGWILMGAGLTAMATWGAGTEWGGTPDAHTTKQPLLTAGATMVVASPLVMATGALLDRAAVNADCAEHQKVTGAPAHWGLAATGMCLAGTYANTLNFDAPIPPITDCSFALVLPGLQMVIDNRPASADQFDDLGAASERPARRLALAPWHAEGRTGLSVLGRF